MLVSIIDRECRKPPLSSASPRLIGWLDYVGRIQGSSIDLNLRFRLIEDRGPASGAEVANSVVSGFTAYINLSGWEDREKVKHSAVMLPTVEAMTDSDANWIGTHY